MMSIYNSVAVTLYFNFWRVLTYTRPDIKEIDDIRTVMNEIWREMIPEEKEEFHKMSDYYVIHGNIENFNSLNGDALKKKKHKKRK